MRQPLRSRLGAFAILLQVADATLDLPAIQPLVNFSQACVDAYTTHLPACSGNLIGLGGIDECSEDCENQLFNTATDIKAVCHPNEVVDNSTLIAAFWKTDVVNTMCSDPHTWCCWHIQEPYTAGSVQTVSTAATTISGSSMYINPPGSSIYIVPTSTSALTSTSTDSTYTAPPVASPTVASPTVASPTSNPEEGSTGKERTERIVGGLVGAIAAIAGVAVVVYFILKRKRKQRNAAIEAMDTTPEADDETGRRMLDGRPVWQELEQKEPLASDEKSTRFIPQRRSSAQHEMDGDMGSRFWPDGVNGGDGFVYEMPG